MLFGAIGASWAQTLQKYTGQAGIGYLLEGDTLAPGFSLTCNPEAIISSTLYLNANTYKKNGIMGTTQKSFACSDILQLVYGPDGAITLGGDTYTPVDGSADGNACVACLRTP